MRSCSKALVSRLGGCLLVALVCLARPAQGDRIRTVDGRIIEGVITAREIGAGGREVLKIRIGRTIIGLPVEKIEYIAEAMPGENAMLLARDAFQVGRMDEGVERMAEALDLEGPAGGVGSLLLNHGEKLLGAVPAMGNANRAALSRCLLALEGIRMARQDDLTAIRIPLHLALDQREEANDLLDRLGGDYFPTHLSTRDRLSEWLLQAVDASAEEGGFDRALEAVEDLGRINPALAEGRRIQLHLQIAWNARDERRYGDALDVYVRHVLDEAPLIARDRILITLTTAERWFRSRDDFTRAARLYEQYGMVHASEEARPRFVQLWRDQGWRRLRQADFDLAEEAFERAELIQPGATDVDRLHLQYRRRGAALASDDDRGHYELGRWCLENSLIDEALKEFGEVAAAGGYGEAANAYMRRIHNQLAEAELERMMDLYDTGEYGQVLRDVHGFLRKDYPQGFKSQAIEIRMLTRQTIDQTVNQRAQQAAALFQQAQRAYFGNRFEEAERLLRTIVETYEDTIVHERASVFYEKVLEKLELGRLERGQSIGADRPSTASPVVPESELNELVEALRRGNTSVEDRSRSYAPDREEQHAPGEQEARRLLAGARDAFFEGRLGDADRLLAVILEQYADTATHRRAERFYRLIRDQLELHKAETARAKVLDRATTPPAAVPPVPGF